MPEYEASIGMEVHAELLTESKMSAGCRTSLARAEYSVLPVCLGMQGSLPVMNKKAVDYVIRASLALNCEIMRTPVSTAELLLSRSPKGYQSLSTTGHRSERLAGHRGRRNATRVHIRRVHLEEDTGKLFPSQAIKRNDYNRSAFRYEIVTEFPAACIRRRKRERT